MENVNYSLHIFHLLGAIIITTINVLVYFIFLKRLNRFFFYFFYFLSVQASIKRLRSHFVVKVIALLIIIKTNEPALQLEYFLWHDIDLSR